MTHDELPEGYKPTNTVEVIAGAGRKYEQTRSMTHDKLLAKVEHYNYMEAGDLIKALRAVVELHKPSEKNYIGEIGCVGCGYNSEYSTWEMEYPCPTIQAIEKDLG